MVYEAFYRYMEPVQKILVLIAYACADPNFFQRGSNFDYVFVVF